MFRPSLHGWPFRNVHACTGPELGTSAAPPELGLGGGMCWAALDRYLRGVEIPRDTRNPDVGDPLHTELVGRQVAALAGLWPRISEWQSAPAGSWRDRLPLPLPLGGSDVASRVRAQWRDLRRRLDADEPVLLTVLLEGGAYDRPRTVRQVLATGWSRSGSRVTLSIYDPDQPEDDDVDLLFSLRGELKARLTGGVPVRGFFPVAYDRTPAPTVRVHRFDDRAVIGLNRSVRGEPGTAAGRKHVDVVARNERGALLHFRRSGNGRWEGTNVLEAEGLEAHEIHSDPAAVHQTGALHVFARDYAGDLLHFRKGRSWSVTNCTDQKRAGAQFRIVGRPVPLEGPKLQLSVIGRDNDGGVVHYQYAPIRGWRAEQVPGDPVAGDPVAIRDDRGVIHVAALATDGRLLHWSRDDVWTLTDPDAGPGPTVRLQGRPTLVVMDGRVHVIGRGRHNRLILLRLDDSGLWQREGLAGHLAGDPGVAVGPGGLHVVAPTADGGLVHAWRDGVEWVSENVVESRPTLSADEPGSAAVAVWGTDRSLRAFVHRGSRLRVYTWTPDADWVCDPVSERAGTPPVTFRAGDGEPNLVFTDGRGTLVHVDAGPWREPGRHSEAGATSAGADVVAERATAAEREPVTEDEEPAVAEEELPLAAEELPIADEELPVAELPVADEMAESEPAAAAATTEPDAVDDPVLDLGVEELESVDETPDDGAEPEASEEVPDFETERLAAPAPSADRAPEPEAAEELAETALQAEAEDVVYEEAPEREPEEAETPSRSPTGMPGLPGVSGAKADPEDDDWEPRLEMAEEPESGKDGVTERVERKVRKFQWEEREPPTSADDVEPMDLSLLDTWPPPSRGTRRDRDRSGKPSNGRSAGSDGEDDG